MSLVVPPYPPARYTSAQPEVSATLRRVDEPPDYDSHGVIQYHYLANQKKTAGDYGLGFRNEADEPASVLMLFAPGAPREAYFEGFGQLADMTDDERREWFIKHDNFFVE